MKRQHTKKEYLEKVFFLKTINPFIELSSDLIVGFPSESNDDFLETMDVLRQIKFSHIYPFKYSPRPYTRAISMKDDVPQKVKESRLAEVIQLQEKITQKRLSSYIGKTQTVLVDGKHPSLKMWKGRSDTNRPVCIEGKSFSIGDFVNVLITDLKNYTLIGKILS